MRTIFILTVLNFLLFANEVVCKIENETIHCFYHMDRSDNTKEREIQFFWKSPTGADNRTKGMMVPLYHGMVYDYRFLAGREVGKWSVEVQDMRLNKVFKTTFVINKLQSSLIDN